MSEPYLSIVMGIGGNVTEDLIHRFQASTKNTLDLAAKVGLSMELIVSEWNFPEGLKIPRHFDIPDCCSLRWIHVPRELHARMPNPHGFPYFEWYPKNIGIRRANGRFVLSTNPDDLFTLNMFAHFKNGFLKEGHFYRANRHDMRDGKVFQICYPTGTFPPTASEQEVKYSHKWPTTTPYSPSMIHYNASGDFTLMAKSDWMMIHGNPEQPYNNSVDGQTLWLAHLKGLKQIILPMPVFHPDHARTLNYVGGKPMFHIAPWDDNAPFTKENGEDWGFAGMEFPETIL